MRLPRLHLFEIEDQPWFPSAVRDLATDYLHFFQTRFGLQRPAVPVLLEALRASESVEILDLCSGGGGPILVLRRDLASHGAQVRITLTDRYPNLEALRRIAAQSGGDVTFVAMPVDARAVPLELAGLRTLFNAFHHFRPSDAARVLRGAVEAGRPIAVFEIPERSAGRIAAVFFLTPLFVILTTPFIRPFRWRRLLWTYLVPLVPLTCLWDGVVSQLRAYTVDELERLTEGLEEYEWRAGRASAPGAPARVTYLMGWRRPAGQAP